MAKIKVPISERALFQRINRKLSQQTNPEMLRKARTASQREELGDYFTVDKGTFGEPRRAVSQGVGRADIKLEDFGRKLGALAEYEVLAK